MAYSEKLAARTEAALDGVKRVQAKKMMGGLCYMIDGKMALAVLGDDLMVRLDPEIRPQALGKKGCREKGFRDRPVKAFVFVGPEGTKTAKDLRYWVGLALDYNPRAKASAKKR